MVGWTCLIPSLSEITTAPLHHHAITPLRQHTTTKPPALQHTLRLRPLTTAYRRATAAHPYAHRDGESAVAAVSPAPPPALRLALILLPPVHALHHHIHRSNRLFMEIPQLAPYFSSVLRFKWFLLRGKNSIVGQKLWTPEQLKPFLKV